MAAPAPPETGTTGLRMATLLAPRVGAREKPAPPATRRTVRAYWMTTAFLSLFAPALLLLAALVSEWSRGGLPGPDRLAEAMRGLLTFTTFAMPVSFVASMILMLVAAVPTVRIVRGTRAEHAVVIVGVATLFAALLPILWVLLMSAGASRPTQAGLLLPSLLLAPAGTVVGVVFWRIYAGRWCWRIEDERIAEVF